MERIKRIIGCLCSCIMLFAFSIDCFAMDFDAELTYESIFVIYSGKSEGSGFAIGKNTIVTNAHVIENRNSIMVKTYSGEEYCASVFLYNEPLDIAILSVEGTEFNPLEMGDSDAVKVGEDIYAIGAPRSLDYTLTKGVISNKSRAIGFNKYIQIDAAINSGNSGGPLLNSKGQVIGVNSMKISNAEGIGLAIPISTVTNFIEGNDVHLTEDKHVEGLVEDVPAETFKNDEEKKTKDREEADDSLSIVLGMFFGVSVLLNIVLIIKLVYKKNKDIVVLTDWRDRTDFEIDILE